MTFNDYMPLKERGMRYGRRQRDSHTNSNHLHSRGNLLRKAQQRMALGKPYAERIRSVISHIANASPEYQHAYMVQREVKNVGFIVISSDRGLCGGLNTNVFKKTVRAMQEYDEQGVGIEICTIGSKGASFFGGMGAKISATVRDLGEDPAVADLIGAVKVILDNFTHGAIDKLYIVSNDYVNTMTQTPVVRQLLPLLPEDVQSKHRWDYIYEPDAKELLDGLFLRFIESQVYQSVVENGACEQAARMLAMKNATDNAGEIIDTLQTIYNRARQAAITQEISEIVAGAAAV